MSEAAKMKPRRLQSATTLSMVTTSSGTRLVSLGARGRSYTRVHADLRVPLRERAPLRGDAADLRRAGDGVRGVRGPGDPRLPPDRGALQGVRLLQHRLRHGQAQARDGQVRLRRREEERRQAG